MCKTHNILSPYVKSDDDKYVCKQLFLLNDLFHTQRAMLIIVLKANFIHE
jgi:hypothetical protein